MMSGASLSNRDVAAVPRGDWRAAAVRGRKSFRVAAYRRAAATVRGWPRAVAEIFAEEGDGGAARPCRGSGLRWRGRSLACCGKVGRKSSSGCASAITGCRCCVLCRAWGRSWPADAAIDWRRLAGRGVRRGLRWAVGARAGIGTEADSRAIRESLAARLQTGDPLPPARNSDEPPVSVLLSIDEEYRELAAAGRLPLARPRLFNPSGSHWLPVLRTQRGGRPFTAHYANTARSHRLGRFGDWVIITCDAKQCPASGPSSPPRAASCVAAASSCTASKIAASITVSVDINCRWRSTKNRRRTIEERRVSRRRGIVVERRLLRRGRRDYDFSVAHRRAQPEGASGGFERGGGSRALELHRHQCLAAFAFRFSDVPSMAIGTCVISLRKSANAPAARRRNRSR